MQTEERIVQHHTSFVNFAACLLAYNLANTVFRGMTPVGQVVVVVRIDNSLFLTVLSTSFSMQRHF